MGRIGDIESKSVASRVPMSTYIKLISESSKRKMTISSYIEEKLSNDVKLELGGALITDNDTIKNLKSKVSELEKEISALKSKKTPVNGNLDKEKIKNILSRNPNLQIEKYNGDSQTQNNPKLKPFCLECYEISKLING